MGTRNIERKTQCVFTHPHIKYTPSKSLHFSHFPVLCNGYVILLTGICCRLQTHIGQYRQYHMYTTYFLWCILSLFDSYVHLLKQALLHQNLYSIYVIKSVKKKDQIHVHMFITLTSVSDHVQKKATTLQLEYSNWLLILAGAIFCYYSSTPSIIENLKCLSVNISNLYIVH